MSKIGKGEWFILYAVAGFIDVLQWLADITGVGAPVNEAVDPFIGVAIGAYFQLRGVSMITHWKRFASLVGAVALEELSVSIAPAWIFDVWYIHRDVKNEDAQIQASKEEAVLLENAVRQPLNQDGVRSPQISTSSSTQTLNVDGIRPPKQA